MGLFGPKKGKIEFVNQDTINDFIKKNKLSSRISSNNFSLYTDEYSYDVSINNKTLKVKSKKYAYEMQIDGVSIAATTFNSNVMYIVSNRKNDIKNHIDTKEDAKKEKKIKEELDTKKEFNLSEIDSIDVEVDNIDVRVTSSNNLENSNGSVVLEGDPSNYRNFQFDAYTKGSTLYVREKDDGSFNGNVIVIIDILKKVYRSVKIVSSNGDVGYYADGSVFLDGTFKNNNGDTEINFKTKDINFKAPLNVLLVTSENGDIDYNFELVSNDEIKLFKTVKFNTDNGDMDIQNIAGMKVDLNTSCGDVDFSGFAGDLRANSENGDLDIKHIYFRDGSAEIETDNGDIDYKPVNVREMKLEVTGDVSSKRFKKDPNGFVANVAIRTDNGDINIG